MKIDRAILNAIRKETSKSIAESIVSVQPMANNFFSELMRYAKNEKELIEEGYEPISKDTKLMWIKKEK